MQKKGCLYTDRNTNHFNYKFKFIGNDKNCDKLKEIIQKQFLLQRYKLY